jgi:hypothetical protein
MRTTLPGHPCTPRPWQIGDVVRTNNGLRGTIVRLYRDADGHERARVECHVDASSGTAGSGLFAMTELTLVAHLVPSAQHDPPLVDDE